MKLITSSIAALLVAGPALAGTVAYIPDDTMAFTPAPASTFGGAVKLGYGYNMASVEDSDAPNDEYTDTFYFLDGTVGSSFGSFGWQFDAGTEMATFTEYGDFYSMTAYTAHLNYDIGGYRVGGFYGMGQWDEIYSDDQGDMTWYGLEAATEFSGILMTAHVGAASSEATHSSLDFTDYMFYGVQARYFVSDNLMITGLLNSSMGQIHSEEMTQLDYSVEATMRLGGSDFYGSALLGGTTVDANGDGSGTEMRAEIGVSYLFGGDLRSVYGTSTPMMEKSVLTRMGVNTSIYD